MINHDIQNTTYQVFYRFMVAAIRVDFYLVVNIRIIIFEKYSIQNDYKILGARGNVAYYGWISKKTKV